MMIAPSFSVRLPPCWLGPATDVSHSSRPRPQLPCSSFVADPAIEHPGRPCWARSTRVRCRVTTVMGPPDIPLADHVLSGHMDVWLMSGDQALTDRDLALDSERPGGTMFAQGAMTTIARCQWGLPAKPRESGSDRRLVAQIRHEPSRKRPAPLPILARGC